MSTDPRVALQSLTNALEEHLSAVANRRGENDPAVDAAYLRIADSFDAYEQTLYDTFDEVTPLEVVEEDDGENDDDDESGTDDELEFVQR